MTKIKTPTTYGRRRCYGGRDTRGSAIVLVLVSMVLMALLAGSLLQLTRFERIPRSESNIEIVIESVVAEILNQVTDDVLDGNNYLNAGAGDEPWDFPWTRPDTTLGKNVDYFNGTSIVSANVYGGEMDDSWLAPQMPDFRTEASLPASSLYDGDPDNTGVGVWRKITNLTSVYLGGTGGSSDLTTVAVPNEYPNFSNAELNRDSNHLTSSALLVDADGDGIGDSRWEWAPLRQVGATQYVFAARIIDLSARADLNTILSSTPSDSPPTPTLSSRDPRGDSPAELDGSGLVQLFDSLDTALATNDAHRDWRKILDYRLTSPNDVTTLTGTNSVFDYDSNSATPPAGTRRDLWTKGASRISNTFARYGEPSPGGGYDYSASLSLVDAFELLQGNGVGSSNTTDVENLMPNVLRRDAGTGGQEGTFATGTPPRSWNQAQFWQIDPRKHFTTLGGSAIVAKPAATGQTHELKVDVNRAVETDSLDPIDTAISRVANATLAGLYPHLDAAQLADQLTANIADYIDDDNVLTEHGTAIGFEALPFITEVYTQRYYEVTNVAPPSTSTGNDVTWTAQGAQGYVIEIGNPFAPDVSGRGRPVSLNNIWIDMNGSLTELSTLTNVPAELGPGEVLLLYRNSGGPINNLETYYDDTSRGNTDGNFTTVHVAQGPVMDGTAATQTIGLRAALESAPTNAAGFNYSACIIEVGGASTIKPADANAIAGPPVPANHFSYIQTHYVGHGVGLRMMTVTKGGGSNDYAVDKTTLDDPSINCNVAGGGVALQTITTTLANETKAGAPAGFANLDSDPVTGAPQQIVWPDSDRERMHWIGDILQIPLIGPQAAGATEDEMAAAFVAAAGGTTLNNATTGSGINALLLPYAGNTVVNAGTGSGVFNYPHGLLILEQMTTFSPASDGQNGDNSNPVGGESVASPNKDEALVPGRINLNTAPENVLVGLLPFPDEPTRRAVAAAIIERRESMAQSTNYGMGANNIPGVAYTTAMYDQIATLPSGTPAGFINGSLDNSDTTTLGTANTQIDLNDYETALGTYISADGVIDDREEKIMLAKWLTEVAETRSDVFAAYIVVQGYPADNFSEGAKESARLIVIFSRANVQGAGDRAVELGRFRIN